jgi:hypothetical protein
MRSGWLALLLAACGGAGNSPTLDGTSTNPADGTQPRGDGPQVADGPSGGSAYRHTIAIDGTNDFTAGETFQTTTSPTFTAYVTWDNDNVYLGYSGPDLATDVADASTKWLFAYIDVDPGSSTGAATSVLYNTQQATFPMGFGAEYYLRFKSDGTFKELDKYDGTTWNAMSSSPDSANSGTYTEAAFPRSLLPGETAGIVTFMINEEDNFESTYAGLYAGDFTDGYGSDVVLAHYLKADFTSPGEPDDGANRAPTAGGSGMEN